MTKVTARNLVSGEGWAAAETTVKETPKGGRKAAFRLAWMELICGPASLTKHDQASGILF